MDLNQVQKDATVSIGKLVDTMSMEMRMDLPLPHLDGFLLVVQPLNYSLPAHIPVGTLVTSRRRDVYQLHH